MNKNSEDIRKEQQSLKIRRIRKIADYGIFKNFEWEKGLNKFKRYNLFYGWNGSGKSTLSRLFSYLENRGVSGENEKTHADYDKIAKAGVVFEIDSDKEDKAREEINFAEIKPDQKLPQVKVFNKDFVKNNVFLHDGEARGIVSLGADNIAKQITLKKREKELEDLEQEIKNKTKEKEEKESSFYNFKRDAAKSIRSALGIENPHEYDGRNFQNNCKPMLQLSNADLKAELKAKLKEKILSDEEREKLEKSVRKGAQETEEISKLTFSVEDKYETEKPIEFDFLKVNTINRKVAELCNKDPSLESEANAESQGSIGKDTTDESRNEDNKSPWKDTHLAWLKEGIEHQTNLSARDRGDCLFCQQKLPEGLEIFVKEIEKHLKADKEKKELKKKQLKADADKGKITLLQRDLEKVKNHVADIIEAIDRVRNQMPKNLELGDQQKDFEKKKKIFFDVCEKVRHRLKELEGVLDKKLRNLPALIKIDLLDITVKGNANEMVEELNRFIKIANEEIAKDNEAAVDDIEDAKAKLKGHYIATNFKEYEDYRTEIGELGEEISKLEDKEKIEEEIKKLSSEINNIKLPAEDMNKDLQEYFGRKELTFVCEEEIYKIERNGRVVQDDLSEGEQTAIAFIYFLQTLSADEFDLEKGVVVIDDPISSLDENGLYNAFRLTTTKTENAGQLFVFTHNFSFFKKIRRWFKDIKNEHTKNEHTKNKHTKNNNYCYYMFSTKVSRDDGNETRVSEVKQLDKFLKDYDSEYHYLFSLVYNAAKDESLRSFIDNYHLPNVARKVFESFSALQYPGESLEKSLYKLIEKITKDPVKARNIASFFNNFSHRKTTPDDVETHGVVPDQDLKKILQDLLEIIKKANKEHYSSMEELIEE